MDSYDAVKANKSFSGTDMVAIAHMSGTDGSKALHVLGMLQTITYSTHMNRSPIRSIGNINAKDYVQGPRTIAGTLIFAVFDRHFAYKAMEKIREPRHAFLADELPPFDITISYANEYGAQARAVIYGIRLVNEGQVMSVNDIYTENTYQFVASDIEYMDQSDGYSNFKNSQYNRRIRSSKPQDKKVTTGKQVANTPSNGTNGTAASSITVNVDPLYPAAAGKKGTVKVTVSPAQEKGIVRITGGNLKTPLDVYVLEYKNAPIYVSLAAGAYTATYIGTTTSRPYSFVLAQAAVASNNQKAAPTVEGFTDTQISLFINDASHTVVKYAEINGTGVVTFKEKAVAKRRCVLSDLKAKTRYLIYSENASSQSLRIYVDTLEFDMKPFTDLRQYLLYNRNTLDAGDISTYLAVVDGAEAIARSKTGTNLVQAISGYRSQLETQIKNLKPANFPTQAAYTAKLAELNALKACAADVVVIAAQVLNYNLAGVNIESTLKPPQPEMIDAINNVFLIEDNVEYLEFYRQYAHTAQFALEVKKISFYTHSSGKKAFRYPGKPGVNHYVFAYNLAGERSSRLEFYCMTDAEREKALGGYQAGSESAQRLVNAAESKYGKDFSALNVTKQNYDRLLIQMAKGGQGSYFPRPHILSQTGTSVLLQTTYPELINEFDDNFYMCLAPIKEALLKRHRQKIAFNRLINSVQFTAAHGVTPGNAYALWIENEEGVQVSPCTTFVAYKEWTPSIEDEEERIALYFVRGLVGNIRQAFSNRFALTEELKSIFSSLVDDTTVNERNVYTRLIENIATYRPMLKNASLMIQALLECRLNQMVVSETFFTNNVVLDSQARTAAFPSKAGGYMIVVEKYDVDKLTIETQSVGNNGVGQVGLAGGSYVMAYAVDRSMQVRSGMVYANPMAGTMKPYRLNATGGTT